MCCDVPKMQITTLSYIFKDADNGCSSTESDKSVDGTPDKDLEMLR